METDSSRNIEPPNKPEAYIFFFQNISKLRERRTSSEYSEFVILNLFEIPCLDLGIFVILYVA
jgi:hypothetical protein